MLQVILANMTIYVIEVILLCQGEGYESVQISACFNVIRLPYHLDE